MRALDSLWIEWKIALRFLADNRLQTLMISLGIAVGSAVIVFITALISGLQANIIERTLGTQAHIRVLAPDEANAALPVPGNAALFLLETPRAQRCAPSPTGRTCWWRWMPRPTSRPPRR